MLIRDVITEAHEYAELKQRVRAKGLLDKQPAYYAYKLMLTLGMLVLCLTVLVVVNSFWFQLLNAIYMSVVFTQIAFISHDVGHRQLFVATRKNDIAGLVVGNLLLGVSRGWWIDKHNRHHSHPNQLDLDPDIAIPCIAFTEEEARRKRKLLQFLVKYQVYLFFPLLMVVAIGLQVESMQFLLRGKGKYLRTELLFTIVHHLLYFGLLLYRLNGWQALLFIVIHQASFGLYLGSVFAPNHKGMPILDKGNSTSFLRRQVLTARNVRAHPLTDFWYGGLNYQIEHHLFPGMPRNKLREAQLIVKAFCETHSISYYETGMLQSYREILHCLHQVGMSLREEKLT
ncbi:MAG: acyl-CoA desaturase [Ktedonobacteraceae bacterium]